MNTKVLIVDDHPLFRAAMKQALVDLVGDGILEADSVQSAASILDTEIDVECVFLDLNMPGNQGLVGLQTLRSQYPDVLVVIVSADEDPAMISKAMGLGASGYIPKSTPLETIADAVEEVLEGETWLPEYMIEAINKAKQLEQPDFAERLNQLTPHQFKVLQLMADGLLNKQIAYELDISESTVKQHVSAVLKKLQVINRTKAGVLFKQMMGAEEVA